MKAAAAAIPFDQLQFRHDAFGRLVMIWPDGRVAEDLEPVRCFPWSATDGAIALLDADARELLLLPTLAVLSDTARSVLERDLSGREFTPRILRIAKSSGIWPPCTWQVETDRGPTALTIDSEDDVRRLGSHGALIADSSGVRFLIPDARQLDASSLRHLRRLL